MRRSRRAAAAAAIAALAHVDSSAAAMVLPDNIFTKTSIPARAGLSAEVAPGLVNSAANKFGGRKGVRHKRSMVPIVEMAMLSAINDIARVPFA
eukprot:2086670-Pyramimonas_sp.AAC.1